ncbi:MAG: flagellar biosynthetic protein FliO [Lachnospiraceae bacterium]|nr:flagellar biosynthetic protein FliO [uncultured Agathobacter sp.]MCI7113642.1 flagellar biosynthetic protein FliO [Lachnobacterium sp.]MDD6138667.1 flagellar biosynthetic protein FliO [Lachnospiraceae bacterium]MDY6156112.1 flagellar biosynthetic protein FliO [Agathobacter sp.]
MDDILMTSSLESFMQLISVLVIFVFVLVITYVTTRWMAGFQKSRSYNKNLKIIETIAVGNNKLISIVAVGKKYIAVSVGKDDVHFLTEIKEDELKDLSFLDEADKESAKESFANILEKLKKSHSDRSKNE